MSMLADAGQGGGGLVGLDGGSASHDKQGRAANRRGSQLRKVGRWWKRAAKQGKVELGVVGLDHSGQGHGW